MLTAACANGEVRFADDFGTDLTVIAISYFTNKLVIVSTIPGLFTSIRPSAISIVGLIFGNHVQGPNYKLVQAMVCDV